MDSLKSLLINKCKQMIENKLNRFADCEDEHFALLKPKKIFCLLFVMTLYKHKLYPIGSYALTTIVANRAGTRLLVVFL